MIRGAIHQRRFQMTVTTKLSMVSVFAMLIAAPAMAAQLPATGGDYYAPIKTVVQQPTAQELKDAQEGDFYSPMKGYQISASRAAAIEKCTQRADAAYGPSGGTSWRRFNHDVYAACMADAGQPA
jgi:hypothetical protein